MSSRDLYSQLKPAWHPQALEVLRQGGTPRPIHVQLILSDLCNQDCHFCAYRMSAGLSNELFGTAETHNPNRKIPTPKALEIVEDCAELGVKAIQFTGGGANPRFTRIICRCSHAHRRLAWKPRS
jgi:Fe-coproporphyrin III synthase